MRNERRANTKAFPFVCTMRRTVHSFDAARILLMGCMLSGVMHNERIQWKNDFDLIDIDLSRQNNTKNDANSFELRIHCGIL